MNYSPLKLYGFWQHHNSGVNDLSRPGPTTPRLRQQIILSLPHLPPLSHLFRGGERERDTHKSVKHIMTLQVYFRLLKYVTHG